MRVAEVLSDLTSLRACDQDAALALVSVRPLVTKAGDAKSTTSNAEQDKDQDADLRRAQDLARLHHAFSESYVNGQVDVGLLEARRAVQQLNIK